jgi:hypothetical protein
MLAWTTFAFGIAAAAGAVQCGNTTTQCASAELCCQVEYSPTTFGC